MRVRWGLSPKPDNYEGPLLRDGANLPYQEQLAGRREAFGSPLCCRIETRVEYCRIEPYRCKTQESGSTRQEQDDQGRLAGNTRGSYRSPPNRLPGQTEHF
ncbi:hypothetical protein MVEG_08992 [Podila verticillata NRRL 6337]|nr:hypothetical protein MVEG_08992 [Podila verticillata NRRL 6337]